MTTSPAEDRVAVLNKKLSSLRAEIDRLKESSATESLRAERFVRAIEHAPVVMWAVDRDGVFTLSEGGGLHALGLRPGEVVGQSAYELYAGTDVGACIDRAFSGETFSSIVTVRGLSFESLYAPVLDDTGTVIGVSGVSTDVTERVRAESALRESEKKFRSLVETTSDWVWEVDEELRYVYASPRVREMLGVSPDDVVGRSRFEFISEADRDRVRSEIADAVSHSSTYHAMQFSCVHRDGRTVVVESSGTPVPGANGTVAGYRGIDRDITEQIDAQHAAHLLQEQLFHAQKMETIGQLAGGIAHDFNNILSPILGYTEMAIEALEPGHPVRDDLNHVTRAGHRARDLVNQILVFSSREEHNRVALQPHLIAREVVGLLRSTIPATAEITQSIDANAGWAIADAGQIHQVLMNLGTNAAQAIGSHTGKIRIVVRAAHISDSSTPGPGMNTGDYVMLSVSDTGPGMDPETKRRIFEPFFTTREVGKGTGLGLSVVHGIVQGHNGVLQVDTAPGRGATFSIYLPAVRPGAEVTEPRSDNVLAGGREHILLVDDESDIARLGQRLLEPLGYRVTAFDNPRSALRAFRRSPAAFDILVTDLTMPRMTGLELADEVRSLDAAIPIVLTTGYADVVSPEQARSHGITDFIMKPLVGRALTQKIRRAIDATSRPRNGE